MTTQAERKILRQRRDFALNDLEELAQQVADGEIDAATADRLRGAYQLEIDEIDELLAGARTAKPLGPTDPPQSFEGRGIRIAVITLVIVAVLSVVVIVMSRDPGTSSIAATGEGAPPTTAADGGSSGMPTLDEMEAVVAANPEVVGMRLALADQYYTAGAMEQAAGHYEEALEHNPTGDEAHYVLTRLGAIAYFEGRSQDALAYLTPLVEAEPNNAEARFYLGATFLNLLQQPDSAIPLFEELLAMPDLAPSAATQVEQMLEAARMMAGDG